jgi:hypothetical protein
MIMVFIHIFPDLGPLNNSNVVVGDKDINDKYTGCYWFHWGDNTLMYFGYFFIYDVATQKYYFIILEPNKSSGWNNCNTNMSSF